MTLPLSGFLTGSGGGAAGGTGDVVGPASSTNNAAVRWDLATGKLVQDSNLFVSDTTGTADNSAGNGKYISGGTNSTAYFVMGGVGAGNFGLGLDANGIPSILNGNVTGVGYFRSSGYVAGASIDPIFFGDTTSAYPRLTQFPAGTLILRGGASTSAPLKVGRSVIPSTAGSGAPLAINGSDSWAVFTNEGATAAAYFTLPTAYAGAHYTFVVQDADGTRVVASAGDTIRVIDKVTAAAGYIESTTIGSTVTLVSVNAVEWYAVAINGIWTDGTFTYDDTSLTTP